ncbi:MAG: helix-turn-helix transcriptional regulator [Deltaproteobacteria bacterium]|nr:helix-turn-helix transcriptional regulator [Deltaproteobacteria bacterium]
MNFNIRICGMTRRPAHAPFFVEEDETLGQRLARYRRERGFTQIELAEKMQSIQTLISDYERDQLRPHPEMLVKFAAALEVSADELLGLKKQPRQPSSSRRWVKRVQAIEKLPKRDQDALVRTIDAFLTKAS